MSFELLAVNQGSLSTAIKTLEAFQPTFFSIPQQNTHSSECKTLTALQKIQQQTQTPLAAHLTCINKSRTQILDELSQYQALQVNRLIVIQGDTLPNKTNSSQDFQYVAQLIYFIREHFEDHFHISVAAEPAHYQHKDYGKQALTYFIDKLNAGADMAITQYFFNAQDYFYLQEACAKKGVNIPIVPGIMPIIGLKQIQQISERCHVEVPSWLNRQLDDKEGFQITTELCETLINGGAPSLHFYTLKYLESVKKIMLQLI